MAKKGKKIRLLKGELMMYFILLALIIAIPIFNVYTSSMLSETNNSIEKVKKKISKQELANQSLSMQIDELASLQNIQDIAAKYGLSYQVSNIKSVSKE